MLYSVSTAVNLLSQMVLKVQLSTRSVHERAIYCEDLRTLVMMHVFIPECYYDTIHQSLVCLHLELAQYPTKEENAVKLSCDSCGVLLQCVLCSEYVVSCSAYTIRKSVDG